MPSSTPVELAIVKSIPAPPGHTTSGEPTLTVINLLNVDGFALAEKGWIPKRRQSKIAVSAPGLYGGKQPQYFTEDNVTEAFNLIATGVTRISRDGLISALERMAEDARAFHAGGYQADPVYLKVRWPGTNRPQYASIYNINISPELDPFEEAKSTKLAITVEREPDWFFLPLGSNPKIQTYELAGTPYTPADLALDTATGSVDNNLFSALVGNGSVLTSLAGSAFTQTGHVDIPANKIPGDRPALLQFSMGKDAGLDQKTDVRLHIATRSLPLSYPNLSAAEHCNCLAAADGVLGGDAVYTADSGSVKNRVTVNFAVSATDGYRLRFTNIALPVMSGRYAAFVRARQQGGAAGQIFMHLEVVNESAVAGAAPIKLPEQILTYTGTTGYVLHYMGIVELPVAPAAIPVTSAGLNSAAGTAQIQIWARRATGAGELYIADLVLMPIDENYIIISGGFLTNDYDMVYDSTRYYQHGRSNDYAASMQKNTAALIGLGEQQGGLIKLRPGRVNRIYTIWEYNGTGGIYSGPTDNTKRFRGNVLSSWAGVIDV